MNDEVKYTRLRCVVKNKIFYERKDNYSVFAATLEDSGADVVVTGYSFDVIEGILLEVQGNWVQHEKYGRQFEAISWMEVRPESLTGIEKYLASGKIKGIGKKFAHTIVEAFGDQTFNIIENFPEKLIEIPRLGKERAYRASSFIKQQSLERDVMVFLASFGICLAYVKKIIKVFGGTAVQAVRENPYCLIEKIDGISFIIADKIAKKMGYKDDDPRRLHYGVIFVMSQLIKQGDCYIRHEQLLDSAHEILQADKNLIEHAVRSNINAGTLVDDIGKVYLSEYYNAEYYCANRLLSMLSAQSYFRDFSSDEDKILANHAIRHIQSMEGMTFDPVQQQAIHQSLQHSVMILTGGPGTGKTTVLKGILCALRLKNYSIAVCAPTGRAAKRAKESTGYDASTIHRLLCFSWEVNGFKYNEDNHLSEDVVVVDEFSMVDILLFQSLLKAMSPYKRLILVGDVDQLPSVGAGNVLKDLIDSHVIPVVRLEKIFRQQASSRIPYAAQAIKYGRMPDLSNKGSKDFFFISNTDEQQVAEEILTLVAERLPMAYHIKPKDVQVLCPQRSRGTTACYVLNKMLQERLNPKGEALQYSSTFFRVGDSVMQMKNNYDKGVFNGDIGTILFVNEDMGYMIVSFPDHVSDVRYEENDLDELDLAYATTIHKSQGSEYNTVIIPILNSAYIMLQRNLIYTAITRAKERCILIGDRQAIYAAVTNLYVKNRRLFVERQTYLKQRLQQIA